MIPTPITIELNDTDWKPVTTPSGFDRACAIFTNDMSAWMLSTNSNGASAVTIPENLPLSIDQVRNSEELLFYAKAVTGTPILTLFWR